MTGGPATVAIFGSGELARMHARVVVAHPDLRLVSIIERDSESGEALIETVVHRFEGERALLYADSDTALASEQIDIVANPGDASVADALIAAGRIVIGGNPGASARASGRWFPFGDGLPAHLQGSLDAAFADHLRQYERVLGCVATRSEVGT
jgi:hypothetical protein